jgi:predicted Zn-dependent protease
VDNPAQIAAFEKILASGRDDALLRFGLGNAYMNAGEQQQAIAHLRRAVEWDSNYSAAWKLLGKAFAAARQLDDALQAYASGVAAAERNGDKQALKEMRVFIRRLEKSKNQ